VPDGYVPNPDGTGYIPEGYIPNPEGTGYIPEATLPDGTLPDGSIPEVVPEIFLPETEINEEEFVPETDINEEEFVPETFIPEDELPTGGGWWNQFEAMMGAQGGAMAPVNVGTSPLATIEMLLSPYADKTVGEMGPGDADQSAMIKMILNAYQNADETDTDKLDKILEEMQRVA
jgi:hypothetical protein